MLITRDDIQRIGDEETLLHFLEEKLNLPIPAEASLAQIAIPLPLPFLGLDESMDDQIIDCHEFRGLPDDTLGGQKPFLIRFGSEQDYSEILRKVAEGLSQRFINPTEIFFICADEDFQPFAFAYFNDGKLENWQTAMLNILTWTQDNTHIHTNSEHEFPSTFFGEKSTDEFENDLEENTEINEFNITESVSDYDLSTKLKTVGKRLGKGNIYSGFTTAYDKAFIIDAETCKHLVAKDSKSTDLVIRSPQINRKWTCETKYLIRILSSHIKRWPWSDAKNESTAERIFKENYPAIYAHLILHKSGLKRRTKGAQGKFYWEMPDMKFYSKFKRSKIIYRLYPGVSMKVVYDTVEGLPTSSFHVIPTSDLSVLAILNSRCFQWYAQINYPNPRSKGLSLKKGNMLNFPVAPRTEEQKAELSGLVQQILDAPNSRKVPAIEREIDELVYKLYKLTPAEIALIEKGNNP